jgi:outer membrane biosynthesis protein TonB
MKRGWRGGTQSCDKPGAGGVWIGGGTSAGIHVCVVFALAWLHSPRVPLYAAVADDEVVESSIAVDLDAELGPAVAPTPPRPVLARPRPPTAKERVARDASAVVDRRQPASSQPSDPLDDFEAWYAQGAADVLEALDDDEPAPTRPAPVPPDKATPLKLPHVSAGLARALRFYDDFPSLPELARAAGPRQVVDIEICVTDGGVVSEITMDHRAAAALEDALRTAIRTWRYRPLVIGGTARPFCHELEIRYTSS